MSNVWMCWMFVQCSILLLYICTLCYIKDGKTKDSPKIPDRITLTDQRKWDAIDILRQTIVLVFDKKETGWGKHFEKNIPHVLIMNVSFFFSLKLVSESRGEYEIWNEMWNDAQFIADLNCCAHMWEVTERYLECSLLVDFSSCSLKICKDLPCFLSEAHLIVMVLIVL